MGLVDRLKSAVGFDSTSIEIQLFECSECETTFESAKSVDQAFCPECLSKDVTPVSESK